VKEDLENAIFDAWKRVRPRLEADPAELAKRLKRREGMSLRRPPRVWCLGVRAGDTRLAEWNGSGDEVPGEAESVYFDSKMLRELCYPVRIEPPGEPLTVVAAKLGVTVGCLQTARCKGIFRTHFIKGLGGARGWPVPMLYTDKALDPGTREFARPDPLWSWAAWYLTDRIPLDFEQTIVRVPYYRPYTSTKAYEEFRHPEVDAVPRRKSPAPRYLPRDDGRDLAGWYKWKGEEYIGYDWRAAEKNPHIREGYERVQRAKKKRLARYRENRQRRRPASKSGGSIRFNGWLWRCPVCGKTCRTVYYALPPINMLRNEPGVARQPVTIQRLVEGLACLRCHGVQSQTLPDRNAWNQLIGYVTCGLLYGSEVKRPAGVTIARKRAYTPRINAKHSRRRPQVMELLLEDLKYSQIAARLGLSPRTVNDYACKVYAQHGVHSRGELAKRVGRARAEAGPA
jgi:DNA-binding CsgD family transcriptional regulator